MLGLQRCVPEDDNSLSALEKSNEVLFQSKMQSVPLVNPELALFFFFFWGGTFLLRKIIGVWAGPFYFLPLRV